MAASGVRVHSQYVAQKPRRVRFCPSSTQPGARFFAVGGWDAEVKTAVVAVVTVRFSIIIIIIISLFSTPQASQLVLYNAITPQSSAYDVAPSAVARQLATLAVTAETTGLAVRW